MSRTVIKIRAQYHMKRSQGFDTAHWNNPDCKNPNTSDRRVAIIGCGNFSFSNIAYYLSKRYPGCLRSTYDIENARSLSLSRAFRCAHALADWRDIVSDPQVGIVFIASNHASHADYAIACIEAGKHVHIEKPHVISQEQLDRLVVAMKRYPRSKVFLGFNRPRSRLFCALRSILEKEDGKMMLNWFVAGHEIPEGHWYFSGKEGGRVLGNLSHWTDLTLHLVGMKNAFPCTIIPATPLDARSEFILSVIFADRSCASIVFSSGPTFEGVRETLNLQKGHILASLRDFQTLVVDEFDKKRMICSFFRDHGHEANIVNSMDKALDKNAQGEDILYVAATAKFFLGIKQAIESGEKVVLTWEDIVPTLEGTS